jgi:hypothetical protein
MRVQHRHDRGALTFGQRDVLIHEIDVRVDDRERALALAPERVGVT